MSSGNWSVNNFPHYRAGVNGALGTRALKTWSGSNSPHIPKPPTTYVDRPQSFYAWRHGKQVLITRRNRFRVSALPPARARKKPENPYSMSYSNYTIGTFYFGQVFSTYQAGYNGYAYAPAWDSNAEIALMGKLREAVAGSDFNMGVALAESAEAVKLIGDTAKKIALSLKFLRRGRPEKAARVLLGKKRALNVPPDSFKGTLSQQWLELQYGWLPLLKDVENAAQFAAHHLNVPVERVVRVSHTLKSGTYGVVGPVLKPKQFVGMRRKTIIAKLREKDVPRLLGLQDPLSVAWELLPYSFVVDWFIPIGSWMSARELVQSLTGTFVICHKTEATFRGMIMWPGHGDPSEDFLRTAITFERTVTNGLSVPLPAVKPLGKIATWQHAANAVALLTGSR